MLAVFPRRLGCAGRCSGGLLSLLPRQQQATFVDVNIPWVRDRGLEHAVEKEKNFRPFHALKDLLLRGDSPPHFLPLRSISERREELGILLRPISFIRRYPNAFIEDIRTIPSSPAPSSSSPTSSTPSPPAGDSLQFQPRIGATEELVGIHKEEILASESCRADAADRLLRLLMLTRKRCVPLAVVDRLRWDLGLPPDYLLSLLPEFPDYFRVANGPFLELVCWNKDLAVSAMEQSAHKGFQSGMPLPFPLQFPKEFQVNKKVKKWMDEWQKLPYLSPYTDCSCYDFSSAQGEKWGVGVLHELLHLFISKKADKENLLLLSTHAGVSRSVSRKLLVNYPGIFYISNKIGTHTVVLRDAYRRGALVKRHPLVEVRYKYIHLMHKRPKEDASDTLNGKKKARKDAARAATVKEEDAEFEEQTEGEWDESSDHESEESCDEYSDGVCNGGRASDLGQTSDETPEDNNSLPASSPTEGLKRMTSFQRGNSKPTGALRNTGNVKIMTSAGVPEASKEIELNKIRSQLKTMKVYRGLKNKKPLKMKKTFLGQVAGQPTIGS